MPKKIPSILSILRQQLLSPFSTFLILLVAFLYIVFTLFVLNNRLVIDTLFLSGPIIYKLSLFSSLFLGLFTAFSPMDTILTIMGSLLIGANIMLIGKSLSTMQNKGKIRISVGGATVIGLITTGCSSCGFSLLSIIGLGTSLSFLPFKGLELHITSLFLLIFSMWYMAKQVRDSLYCRVR